MSVIPVSEGVVTVVPGSDVRAKRYSALDKVPLLQKSSARQLGGAGFWYVAVDSVGQKALDSLATKLQAAGNAAGSVTGFGDGGLLGVIEKMLGVPRWVVIVTLAVSAITVAGGLAAAAKNIKGK